MPLGQAEVQKKSEVEPTAEEIIEAQLTAILLSPTDWEKQLNELAKAFFNAASDQDKVDRIMFINNSALRKKIVNVFREKAKNREINWSLFPDLNISDLVGRERGENGESFIVTGLDEISDGVDIDYYLGVLIKRITNYLLLVNSERTNQQISNRYTRTQPEDAPDDQLDLMEFN